MEGSFRCASSRGNVVNRSITDISIKVNILADKTGLFSF